MNKKYLMNGLAALAIVAGFSSCVKDVEGSTSQEDTSLTLKEQAALQYGLEIPDGQTWDMATQVTANVTVNGDYGAKYTVSIYENNPFINNTAVLLGRAETVSGGTASTSFTCPNATKSVFVAIKDAKGYSYVKPAVVVDGKIETTFGGDGTASARTMRSAKRSAADNFVVAVRRMPDFSAYINDATPITTENNTTNPANTVRHYVIPAGTAWSDHLELIEASDPNSQDIVSVYVLGTLNINSIQKINGGYGGAYKLIVGNGGVVNIASGATLLSNANQGSGYVGEIHVMAGGTITGDGKLEFSNGTNSYNYNGGTIDVGTLNNNGGTLYNAGTIEADNMLGGSGLSIYENAGKMHIGQAAKGSGTANTRIHNNCWFECDGTLSCRNIQQGPGAYIKAANLEMSGSEDGTGDAAYIWAKGNSLIDIPGAVAFNGVDIVGPTDASYAYLQFGYAETSNGAHGLTTAMNYATEWVNGVEQITSGAILNNIRLSVDHPDTNYNKYNNRQNPYQLLWDMLNGEMACTHIYDVNTNGEWADKQLWPKQGNGNAVMVAKGQVTDVVTESECSPGIEIIPPTPIYEEPKVYSYAFEDRLDEKTDYDLNDVVLKISFPVSQRNSKGEVTKIDSTKLNVALVASGATFMINAYIGETKLFGKEVHEALGKYNDPSVDQPMLNTGRQTATPVSTQIDVPAGWDGNFNNLDVWIYVNEDKSETTKSRKIIKFLEDKEKATPYAIMIPNDWAWPTEQTNIWVAYPGKPTATANVYEEEYSFKTWAETSDAERTDAMKSWFDYPTGLTMKVNN